RVMIPKGETRRIEFSLTKADLSIINARMEQVFEPGDFLFMVGASSDDIRLQKTITL
ncbi:MAG: fibronectin type III-like domain-contianing protein, partial [Prevotella sp.]|nr:fibronectin type III-like domain-contianing protein [Prevotella sp.]